ncbi:Imm10 family immunity protein [Pseudomonas sp. Fl4BN1]|uniref:Imm10 family immunity protein n=1 Tax=Pseudomonas sp. Fl4BN1 TaxID=2697651 RepID=UPI001378E36D|nr:Imm10 family immunity protein [Pseudomonas sp. Fl4BN1]NBF09166.1 hypothetical protein [Pseudomonas sp. Fl4BN1]
MRWTFDATTYSAYVEDEVRFFGLADDPVEPEHYLLLQRAEAFDEQDRALGMATYYVELAGPGAAGYGGIERVQLAEGQLTLHFSPALSWCQALPSLQVRWNAELATLAQVEMALEGIFIDTDTLIQTPSR